MPFIRKGSGRSVSSSTRNRAASCGFSDPAGDEDACGERVQPELDREAAGGAPLSVDVSFSARKHPAQPSAPLLQTPVVANVRTGVV